MLYQQSPLQRELQSRGGAHNAIPHATPHHVPLRPPEADLAQSINYCADFSGCGIWRMKWPEYVLNCTQSTVVHTSTSMILDPRFYHNISTVRVQRQATPSQKKFVEFLRDVSSQNGMKIVYEVDDIIFREDIPLYNKYRSAFTSDEIRETSESIIKLCDEVTVTCDYMKEYYAKKTSHPNITVIPNLPPKFWLDRRYDKVKIGKNYNKHCKSRDRKPRILYAGSGAHFDIDNNNNHHDDFSHVISAVAATVDEFQWVFIGGMPPVFRALLAAGKIEFHPWVQILSLPEFISNLEINCMVAPLMDNTFNRAKSDIKMIEAAAHGIPIVCQDLVTYKDCSMKFNTGEEMISKVRYILKTSKRYNRISAEQHKFIANRWLEDNIDMYKELYTLPYGHPNRVLLNKLNQLDVVN